MWAIAVAGLLWGPLPGIAQEPKGKEETYESAAVKAAVATFNIGDPRLAFGQYLLAGEHSLLEDWQFPRAENFWIKDEGLEVQAALSMIGAGHPLAALGARLAPTETEFAQFGFMKRWQFVFDEPMPLTRRFRDAIKDNRMLPDLRLKTNIPRHVLPEFERVGSPDWGWHQAYLEAIRNAHGATAEMFQKGARKNDHVLFHNLKSNPGEHRGKIVTVTGKLLVLRKEEAPRFAPDGLDFIYIAYVIDPNRRGATYVIALTQMPEGIEKPSENLSLKVTIHAYFLSMVRFPGDRKKKEEDVISPYLDGKTGQVETTPKKDDDGADMSVTYYIVVGSLVGILGIAVLVAILNVWVGRSDRRTAAELAAMREKQRSLNFEPLANEEPLPPEAGIQDADGKPPENQAPETK
jgi:hypothetical protein